MRLAGAISAVRLVVRGFAIRSWVHRSWVVGSPFVGSWVRHSWVREFVQLAVYGFDDLGLTISPMVRRSPLSEFTISLSLSLSVFARVSPFSLCASPEMI